MATELDDSIRFDIELLEAALFFSKLDPQGGTPTAPRMQTPSARAHFDNSTIFIQPLEQP
jgi:hypothetical protein